MSNKHEGPDSARAASWLKAICSAGDRCSCADKNYQWWGRDCEIAIAHVNAIDATTPSEAPPAGGAVTEVMVEAGARGIAAYLTASDGGPSFDAMSEDSRNEAMNTARVCLVAALPEGLKR